MGPYGNQGILLATQVVMSFSLLLSLLGWELTWICGIPAWLIVILMACKKINRKWVIVSITLSLIASVSQFVVAAIRKDIKIYCEKKGNNSNSNNNDDEDNYSTPCNRLFKAFLVLGIISGLSWLVSAVLAYLLFRDLNQKEDSNPTSDIDTVIPVKTAAATTPETTESTTEDP